MSNVTIENAPDLEFILQLKNRLDQCLKHKEIASFRGILSTVAEDFKCVVRVDVEGVTFSYVGI